MQMRAFRALDADFAGTAAIYAGKFVLHKRSCKYASLVAIEPAQPGGG